jgi:uncharacterized protein with HEPN domain
MVRDARAYLWDVEQAAKAIRQFTQDLDATSYAANLLVRSAVERQFEIIGEAFKRRPATRGSRTGFAPDRKLSQPTDSWLRGD